jgi:uncharacterized membrane protein YraQ (UPF0718 family)
MFEQISLILAFMGNAFLHVWPYLVITIPLAVAVQLSGASKYIGRALKARPFTAIILATIVGAFSPFCSCGVIPVVASLLIGGVPLAPVMAFWIASPLMDPEIFFLSVATIGWELAVWRLIASLVLSLSAGFITHFVVRRGLLGQQLLKSSSPSTLLSTKELLKKGWRRFKQLVRPVPVMEMVAAGESLTVPAVCCKESAATVSAAGAIPPVCSPGKEPAAPANSENSNSCGSGPVPFRKRLLDESIKATAMVVKFMALAFFLEALIELYIPSQWIAGLLGRDNPWAIITASVLGVPVYTGNLAALPLVSGLLAQGMNPAAALAFLVSGPTTTLPAMAAVWGLVTRRVFLLYISFSLLGALVLGYLYQLVSSVQKVF